MYGEELENGEVTAEVSTPSDIPGLTSANFIPSASFYATVVFLLAMIFGAMLVKKWW